jgi:hypothetical protein
MEKLMRTNRAVSMIELYFAVMLTAGIFAALAKAQTPRSPVTPRRDLVEAAARKAYEKFRNDRSVCSSARRSREQCEGAKSNRVRNR